MATSAIIGLGTKFQIGNGATPEVFTDLAEVTSIAQPGVTVETQDATHMLSPEGYREFIGGLKDAGEASVTVNHIPGGTAEVALKAALATTKNYRIAFPGALPALAFAAICTGYEPDDVAAGDILTATATFKLSGKPTFLGA